MSDQEYCMLCEAENSQNYPYGMAIGMNPLALAQLQARHAKHNK